MPFGSLGYPRIPGTPLYKHLSVLDWRRLAADIAGFLYQLHGIPVARFSDLDSPVFHAKPKGLEVIKSKVLPCLQLVLSAQEYDVAHQWFEDFFYDERMQEYQPTLIHDEIYYANVLIDEKTSRITGVVGFGDAALGDPAQDIAVQYHLGQDFAETVMVAYRQLMGTLDTMFEHRVRQLWILREFDGLRFYIENGYVEDFAHSVWKMRNGPLSLIDI
jgi:aminoglycoside 2''-phosphotransferase